eukprot:SAG22_NODE_1157_length_5331_cov_1.886086_7_plen_70_part_00
MAAAQELGADAAEALRIVEDVPPRQGESMLAVPFPKLSEVRIGWTGVGARGTGAEPAAAGPQAVALHRV